MVELLFKSQLRADVDADDYRRTRARMLQTWRTHPEHVAAQRRGHDEFYESYAIEVCRTVREYEWRRTGAEH